MSIRILGISAFYHDSAAALIEDGKIVAAAQEERFTRKKHDASFPANAARFCLDFAGLDIDQIDAVAFYDKPLLKFERLLETYYAFAPLGLWSFVTSMPVWLKEKMFLKKLIRQELKKLGARPKLKLLFPEHHLSHAASAFYPSPFGKSAILTLDGVGEWATASIGVGDGKDITILKELQFPHSIGLLYSAFTYFLGFRVNSGEYKLMGLAPYGDPEAAQLKTFLDKIKTELIDIKEDGSLWLNQRYFSYATGLRMVREKSWQNLFGFPRRKPEDELKQHHCNLGLAIQTVTEGIIIRMAAEAKRLTGSENLCMAGGVALNCVANGKLEAQGLFKEIFIQPAAGDAGGAPGAALAAYHLYFEKEREPLSSSDGLQGAFLGPKIDDKALQRMANKYRAVSKSYTDRNELCHEVAGLLSEGNIVAWVQGRMEFGPRALGARSILADARSPEMQKNLNLKIKFRESFRPFAPSVLAEDVSKYFEHEGASPYMLLVKQVKQNIRNNDLPAQYMALPMQEKLYLNRSALPAITHVDFSARIQTVHKKTNPAYWKLLQSFKSITGHGVLVNTSFNVRGEPLVNTAEDAYRCFMRTGIDYLVIENQLFSKKEQPEWPEKDEWKNEFALD